jgi:hypothetical protein
LQTALYFGLESARQEHGQALIDAARSAAVSGGGFEGWSRIVDLRYVLAPLSCAGSVRGEGGRFNIGRRLNPAAFTPYPAMYIGETYDTAFCEVFGQEPAAANGGLTPADLALRKPGSFSHVRLRGQLDLVLDVGDIEALKPIVEVLKTFKLPPQVASLGRRLGVRRPPSLVRSPGALRRQLLTRNWRVLPMQYDLPSNSQVFGRLVSGAGIHAIRYPSARHSDGSCLALFPQNWSGSASFVELMDPAPRGARPTRLDATTGAME